MEEKPRAVRLLHAVTDECYFFHNLSSTNHGRNNPKLQGVVVALSVISSKICGRNVISCTICERNHTVTGKTCVKC